MQAGCNYKVVLNGQRCPLVFTVDHLPDKETRKRKPKKTFEIDFEEDVNFDTYFRTTRVRRCFWWEGLNAGSVTHRCRCVSFCQAATTNSKSALSASNKKTTLPADFQFPPETLSQLSLKPSVCVSVATAPWWRLVSRRRSPPLFSALSS